MKGNFVQQSPVSELQLRNTYVYAVNAIHLIDDCSIRLNRDKFGSVVEDKGGYV